MPADGCDVLRRSLGFGVLCCCFVVDNEAKRLGGASGVIFVIRFELLSADLDQLGRKRAVLAEPLLALELCAFAVAGVGEEVGPLLGQLRTARLVDRSEDRT